MDNKTIEELLKTSILGLKELTEIMNIYTDILSKHILMTNEELNSWNEATDKQEMLSKRLANLILVLTTNLNEDSDKAMREFINECFPGFYPEKN